MSARDIEPRLCAIAEGDPNGASTVRDATNEEKFESFKVRGQLEWLRQESQRIQQRIHELEDGCKHPVFYDLPGFPYDLRKCNACGAIIGSV